MRRELGGVVAEAAEVDELLDARALGFTRGRLGGQKVLLFEVGWAERVDEVAHDVCTLQHERNGIAVGRIRLLPGDPLRGLLFLARHGDDIVRPCQLVDERTADRPRGAEDDDIHPRASLSTLRK